MPFKVTNANCPGSPFQIYVSTKMGTFVQDTVITPLNSNLGVSNVPADLIIPVDAPGFYSFALKMVYKTTAGVEFASYLTDW